MASRVSGLRLALWFALVVLLPLGHTQLWGNELCGQKLEECTNLYQGPQDCTNLNRTIYCFGNFTDHCVNNVLSAAIMRNTTIKQRYCPNSECTTEVQAVCEASFFPPPPTGHGPTTVPNCTYDPPLPQMDPYSPPLTPLGSPSLVPPPSPKKCTLPDYQTNYRQHCSTFSLSHIRPFGDRSLPLQTCILIGNIYLLNHESLSVSIKGNYKMGNSAFYTYISEVNVTLHWHHCFQQTVTYTATTAALSESIPDLADSSLLRLTVENQTVATILAPWINTTIIIHRIDGYLSVTIQVPEPLAREDDVTGLCSGGCVAALQVSDDLPDYKQNCPQNYLNTSIMCLALGIKTPQHIGSGSLYSRLCSYDIALTHDPTLLSLYQALGEDARRLPDITQITTTVTTPTDTPTSDDTSKPPATAIFNTERLVNSAPQVSPLLLTLLVCALTASLLVVR